MIRGALVRTLRLGALPVFVHRVWRDGWSGEPAPAEVVVVPGARVRPDGSPSPALVRRARLGAQLVLEGWADHLLVTGRGVGPRPEADWMAEIAAQAGVRPDRIERERHAMTTAENALYTSRLLGDRPILIATDRTHLRRCLREFGRHFGSVAGAAVPASPRAELRQLVREAVVEAWREA